MLVGAWPAWSTWMVFGACTLAPAWTSKVRSCASARLTRVARVAMARARKRKSTGCKMLMLLGAAERSVVRWCGSARARHCRSCRRVSVIYPATAPPASRVLPRAVHDDHEAIATPQGRAPGSAPWRGSLLASQAPSIGTRAGLRASYVDAALATNEGRAPKSAALARISAVV